MELYDSLQKFVISSDNFEALKSHAQPLPSPPQAVVKRKLVQATAVAEVEPRHKKEKQEEPKRETKPHDFQVPPDSDTLFWCFHYMDRKEDADYFERHNIVQEKQLKIYWVEQMRKQKDEIKFCASMAHIENQLANERRIDLPTFLSLCGSKNIDVCVLRNKTHFPFICSNLGDLYAVKEVQRNRYGFKLDTLGLQHYKDNYFEIEKINKPLKTVSCYTLEQLQQFCLKLDIPIFKEDTKKKKTKAELYESIVQAMPL